MTTPTTATTGSCWSAPTPQAVRFPARHAPGFPTDLSAEVKPAVGVRVNRISNLADDLALALAAKDVRIEAPIPGKSLVGIEVPNSEIATVSFRELWEQSQTKPENLLEIPLGKAVNGTARTFDLSKMPHLLVAGSTGSGKSVAVNGIIASILMKATTQIGRASVGKECRSRWSPYH